MINSKTNHLGRALYEAYAKHTEWKSLATGDPLPQWDALKPAIQAAWNASAGAAIAFQPEATVVETDFRQVHYETARDISAVEEAALVTEPHDYKPAMERLQNLPTVRLLHASIGLATEAGELLDIIKKHVFYGKPLDKVHVMEEIGDVSWYGRIGADAVNASFLETMLLNVRKLRARYGKQFTEASALRRNEEQEREVLEGKV